MTSQSVLGIVVQAACLLTPMVIIEAGKPTRKTQTGALCSAHLTPVLSTWGRTQPCLFDAQAGGVAAFGFDRPAFQSRTKQRC
jgi:hypothetical protein